MNITVNNSDDPRKSIRAAKGIFVGEDEDGKTFVSTTNIDPSDLVRFVSYLVEYGMIKIATDAMQVTEQDSKKKS